MAHIGMAYIVMACGGNSNDMQACAAARAAGREATPAWRAIGVVDARWAVVS